ncbi:MAG: exodeoxyribonuclease subunit alpha, partial [Pseudomonadota bacterium]
SPDAFDAWANTVLQAHQRFQVLCALRDGPSGVTGLNRRIEDALQLAGVIDPHDTWYLGRPVLVTRNDASLGLMNGDMGLVLQRPRPDGSGWLRRVAFAAPDGGAGVRWVLPSRLNAVETVYALTVHKSQGSEFDHVALVLPEQSSPVLTRELVYTGITRAKRHFTLVQQGPDSVWTEALQRRTQRAGALALGL